MSGRDSDSKRHRSRFDPPQPSPNSKRCRRKDGTQERGRVIITTTTSNVGGHQPHPHPHPDPTTQQEERGSSAGQVGRRSSGQRKPAERGWWKDARNQHNEKEEISQGRGQSDEKSQAKPDDNTSHRCGGFSERKVDQPPTSRKRPTFKEKKIPVDSENVNLTATVTVKSSQFDHPPESKERKEGKSSDQYYFDRPEMQFSNDRAPYKDKTGSGVPVKRKA
ncbi:uncharacterized protein LOC123908513 isoform X1 [Trifolium pratense]|uniref:uncharacterized protein LOC123908513 isoform X1 n=1 Tax=Trifolium pratense TaxID=57577 RepID=UPI001E693972|nr:uncharacterized protein LOC123908513 isoform X1 [Trifolium pratense]